MKVACIQLSSGENYNKNFNIVWSNQWEPTTKTQHASQIYEKQFGNYNHSNEDISKVEVTPAATTSSALKSGS